jgi:hypothetical protein
MQMHIVQKPSLPDLGSCAGGRLHELPAAVPFDSLASTLPVYLQACVAVHCASSNLLHALLARKMVQNTSAVRLQAAARGAPDAPTQLLHRPTVERAAAWLRSQLELRLFGFDIVVHQTTGKHLLRTCTLVKICSW